MPITAHAGSGVHTVLLFLGAERKM